MFVKMAGAAIIAGTLPLSHMNISSETLISRAKTLKKSAQGRD
jgi:hypothetical protein